MPGSLTDYAEKAMLDHMFNQVVLTSPVNTYLSLSEGDPTEAGTGGVEPVGNNYARQPISFGAPAARQIANDAQINFPQASGSWQSVQLDHYGIWDTLSGGNMVAYGPLASPIVVVDQNTPIISIGQATVKLKTEAEKAGPSNNFSDAAAVLLLNHLFRNVAWTPPATYLGYATTVLNEATTGTSVVEPSGNNYSRLLVNPNSGGAPRWALAATPAGTLNNVDNLDMPIPSGSWGTLVAAFVATLSALGDILYYDNEIADQLVTTDDVVRIASGQFTAALA